MKKFAFLLAIVAVLAMSACAFAANEAASITAIGNQAATADTNIGKVTGTVASKDITAPLYYFKKSDKATLTFALSLDHAAGGTNDVPLTGKATELEKDAGKAQIAGMDEATLTGATAGTVNADLSYADVSLDKLPQKIELTELLFKNGSGTGDLVSMDIIPTPVNDMITVGAMPALIEGGLSVDKTAVKMSTSGVAIKGLTKDNVLVSFDKALPSKIEIAISEDGVLSFAAAAGLVSTDVGKYTGYIVVLDGMGDAILVSDDKVGDIKIAGLASDDVLATFTIEVKADANKALAEEVKELAAEEGITLGDYAPGEAVEVTDAVARGLIKDAISRDLKVSADVQMVSLVDVVVAEGGYTVVPSTDIVSKDYTVPAGMKLDFAKFFEVGSKTKMEWIYEGKSGDKNFKYDLVVINGVAPADYKKLDNAGGRIVGNTLFIWDGVSDDKAVDPIVSALSAAKGSSSSSSCDMGFGLAAIAGLAALALRKRSK